VSTNQQRREAAKRKLERQLSRRAERAKRRRIIGVVATVVAVLVVAGGIWFLTTVGDSDDTTTPAASETSTPAEAKNSGGPCAYTETPQEPAAKPVGLPADPAQTPNTGTVNLAVKTDQGDIGLVLDRAKAPCTVQSVEHLAKAKFFDATKCHRLTASAGLKVLQCGDPTGTGTGGPGYTVKDEFPTDLAVATEPQGASVYPRGVLAMANTGQPNSGGSQFFLVYGDSKLPPQYTVFGTIDAAGLATLDKIAAGGITPGNSPEDGEPKLPVNIQTATVA